LLRSYLKKAFWFKVKAGARFPTLRDFPLVKSSNVSRNPEEYIGYFEDLNRAPNAEIGPKGFFYDSF